MFKKYIACELDFQPNAQSVIYITRFIFCAAHFAVNCAAHFSAHCTVLHMVMYTVVHSALHTTAYCLFQNCVRERALPPCTVLHGSALYFTVKQWTVLHCTVLYCIALYCLAVPCISLLYTKLRCTTFNCTVVQLTFRASLKIIYTNLPENSLFSFIFILIECTDSLWGVLVLDSYFSRRPFISTVSPHSFRFFLLNISLTDLCKIHLFANSKL